MADIVIEKINEVFVKVRCDLGIGHELQECFTFMVPGAQFSPKVKNKVWDGKIRLYNLMTKNIYIGLVPDIVDWANKNGYTVDINYDVGAKNLSIKEASEFIRWLKTGMIPHEHQMKAFVHCVRNGRAVILSPTSSGKSFIIYTLSRYLNKKTLVIVPRIGLVKQMTKDIADYGYKKDVHMIMEGSEKDTDSLITISTWQSIQNMKKSWFKQFETVIIDEVHMAKSKAFVKILENCDSCANRFGFTGTLDDIDVHELVIKGLIGPIKQFVTTSQLMEKGIVSKLNIKALILQYPEILRKEKKAFKEAKKENSPVLGYKDEIEFIVTNKERNKFIRNLALSLDKNTLILYQFVDKQGKVLYDDIVSKSNGRPVYFVDGSVSADIREEIRTKVETDKNCIIVASYGTFSTGTSINNLHNIIFASPSKSKIRALQSIGRGLRLHGENKQATLYDISDDLSCRSKKNHTLDHLEKRLMIYSKENFDYKLYRIKLYD